MITYYTLREINKNIIFKKEEINKNNNFLHESVRNEIHYFKDNQSGKTFMSFFDLVYFEIEKHNSKPTLKFDSIEFLACYFSNKNEEVSDQEISQELRGSKTLEIDGNNCYDNSDIKVVFSEKGFAFIEKFNDQNTKFEKVCISFLLAQAYLFYIEKLIINVSESYKRNDFTRMLKLRKEFYIFDLNCFFYNPVTYVNQQQHKIWTSISKVYYVEENHKEAKLQVEDLVNLIDIELKEKEKEQKYNEKKREEDKYIKLQEERDKQNLEFNKRATRLTWITVVIAFLSLGSLISAYKDLDELGGIEYISKLFNEKSQK